MRLFQYYLRQTLEVSFTHPLKILLDDCSLLLERKVWKEVDLTYVYAAAALCALLAGCCVGIIWWKCAKMRRLQNQIMHERMVGFQTEKVFDNRNVVNARANSFEIIDELGENQDVVLHSYESNKCMIENPPTREDSHLFMTATATYEIKKLKYAEDD